jgi:hypothetical protein
LKGSIVGYNERVRTETLVVGDELFSISRQIRELEDFFKIELVKRQGRGIVITDAGKRLAVISREFLKSLNDFDSDCQNLPGRLSLVAPNSIIQWLILPNEGIECLFSMEPTPGRNAQERGESAKGSCPHHGVLKGLFPLEAV